MHPNPKLDWHFMSNSFHSKKEKNAFVDEHTRRETFSFSFSSFQMTDISFPVSLDSIKNHQSVILGVKLEKEKIHFKSSVEYGR